MNNKSLNDLEASLAVISSNITAYNNGNIHNYRPVAVELRKLLCDTQRKTDNSLVKRLFPDIKLSPLSGDQNGINKNTVLYIPGLIKFNGKGNCKLSQLFNETAPSMQLDDWLQQKLIDFKTTIKEFILSVANKEGAHSDKTYNKILQKTKSVFLSNDVLVAKITISIGSYIVKVLEKRITRESYVS